MSFFVPTAGRATKERGKLRATEGDAVMATGRDDEAPEESLVVATVGDTMTGGDGVVGDVVVATGGAGPRMNHLLSRL